MSQTPQTIRVGVVGLGMGRHHAEQYRRVPECELVALCDTDELRLKHVAEQMAVTRTWTDPHALFASGEVDAVSIATPNTTHHPLTMAALEAGLDVLCEKPMAMNTTEAQQMLDAAQSRGRKLAIHFNHRMAASIRYIARFAHKGELGDIYFARAVWHRRRGIPARPSFVHKATAGGGCLIDLGVHMLDQALYVMGFPRVVSVTAKTYRKFDKKLVPDLEMDVEDFAVAMIRFATGAMLEMEISWASHHHHPEQIVLQVYGTEGGALRRTEDYKDLEVSVHRNEHDGLTSSRMVRPPRDMASVQADFIAAIREDREPLCNAEHGVRAMQILDAIYESSRTGREVRMDD